MECACIDKFKETPWVDNQGQVELWFISEQAYSTLIFSKNVSGSKKERKYTAVFTTFPTGKAYDSILVRINTCYNCKVLEK